MASKIENVKIGACRIFFDGYDLGYTKGGASVTVETSTYEKKVDQFGETPIGEVIMGRKVKAKVPMVETTVENLVRIMPGATLVVDASARKATKTITFSTAAPVNGDKITIGGIDFTFKTTATSDVHEISLTGVTTHVLAAAAFAAAVNKAGDVPWTATVAAGVVTITYDNYGTDGNLVTVASAFTTSANCTVAAGVVGVDITKAKVTVPTSVGTDLISIARRLVLRPLGASGSSEDFVIYKAATAGALEFSYSSDSERVFSVEFTGYPDSTNGDALFCYGDPTAA